MCNFVYVVTIDGKKRGREQFRYCDNPYRRNSRHRGLCWQAQSEYSDFAGFLVKESIDSISLTIDPVIKSTLNVKKIENEA